ncbi:MAG: DUF2442 domain-containing protein [Myxococcaceae bacterium]
MLVQIVEVQLRGGHRLFLRFNDGSQGIVDIADVIAFEGVFSSLRDQTNFEKVFVDSQWGTVCWPDNLDLAPEPLYERITGRNPLVAGASGEIRAEGSPGR